MISVPLIVINSSRRRERVLFLLFDLLLLQPSLVSVSAKPTYFGPKRWHVVLADVWSFVCKKDTGPDLRIYISFERNISYGTIPNTVSTSWPWSEFTLVVCSTHGSLNCSVVFVETTPHSWRCSQRLTWGPTEFVHSNVSRVMFIITDKARSRRGGRWKMSVLWKTKNYILRR